MSKLIVNEIEKYDAGQLTITTGTNVSIGSDLTVGGSVTVTGDLSATNITGSISATSVTVTGDLSATNLTGSISAASVLADGVTATTQSSGDNSTKVATTAYVDAATPEIDPDSITRVGTLTELTVSSDATINSLTVGRGGGNDSSNTVVGRDALALNNGGANTAIGDGSMVFNDTGSNNTAVGYYSMVENTTGNGNTAIGLGAMAYSTVSNNNTAIGVDTLHEFEPTSAQGENTAVGAAAGYWLEDGHGNTLIGYGSTPFGSKNDTIVISSGASYTFDKGDSTGFINPSNGGVYQGNNSSTWSTTSDERLKKNIVDNNDGLDKIKDIRVRNFEYRKPEEITELRHSDAINKEGVQLGVIAQELQQVLPECVKQESTGVYSLETDNLMWYMINAIKELKAEIDILKSK